MRVRLLDLAVAAVCVACACAPLLPVVQAADGPNSSVIESSGSVDQRVLETGVISNALNGTFPAGNSGTIDGSLQWDLYTTAASGMKMVASTDRKPAMRDAKNNVDVTDFSAAPADWSVDSGDRRFGFSATGPMVLSRFSDGKLWRGFEGTRGVEVARQTGAFGRTRTTLRLRAQFASALAADARPTANLVLTAVPNL